MRTQIKRWLAPPVFEGDEEKTWRASLINATTIVTMIMIIILIIGNLIGGKIPTAVVVIDVMVFTVLLIARYMLFKGKVELAGIFPIVFGIILIAAGAATLGTIRTPTTAGFMLIVIISGFVFGKKGLILSTISSSLLVLGLVLAENAGMLPRPDSTVNITQWITYTTLFGLTGALAYFSYQSMIQALKRMSKESDERKRVEEALKESEARLIEAQHIAHIGSWDFRLTEAQQFTHIRSWDFETYTDTTFYWSDEMYRIFNQIPESFTPTLDKINELVHPDDQEAVTNFLTENINKRQEKFTFEHRIINPDGSIRYVISTGNVVYDKKGTPLRFSGVTQDITDRKQAEEKLRIASITDDLTGLFNQRHFNKKITEEVKRANRISYPLFLMIFDIDDFKIYNDTYGHLKGNEILKIVGDVTKESIRHDTDTAFRYGGDEFAVILPNAQEEKVNAVGSRIKERLKRKAKGIEISIGFEILKEYQSVNDLVKAADEAMYTQKSKIKMNKGYQRQ